MKERGLEIFTSESLQNHIKYVRSMEKYNQKYPDATEYESGRDGNMSWYQLKVWINEDEAAKVKDDGTNSQRV